MSNAADKPTKDEREIRSFFFLLKRGKTVESRPRDVRFPGHFGTKQPTGKSDRSDRVTLKYAVDSRFFKKPDEFTIVRRQRLLKRRERHSPISVLGSKCTGRFLFNLT